MASKSPITQLSALIHASTARSIHNTDYLLVRLAKLLSTPTGIDSVILTIQYTLKFVAARLVKRIESQLAALANGIASKASTALLPGETVVATVPAPAETARLAKIAEASKALSGKCSDVRMFMRLWALLPIYTWARATWLSPPKDGVLLAISWGQILACTGFQFLENVYYLAALGVLNGEYWQGAEGNKRKLKAITISSQLWGVHIALDFLRLVYEWRREARGEHPENFLTGEKEVSLRESRKKARANLWWRQLINSTFYAPMAAHYSVPAGPLSDQFIGFLGIVVGTTKLRYLWATAA